MMTFKRIFLISLIFLILASICYVFIDPKLTADLHYLRVHYYVLFRILSILISPSTHLAFWTSFFVWGLFIKKSASLSRFFYPLVASMIITNTIVRFVKYFFGRSRPDLLILNGIYDLKFFSFDRYFSSLPSGHAATIASLFAFLCFIYPKYTAYFIFLSLALSMSRVIIGAHYLSDILLGNFLGFIVTTICFHVYNEHNPSFLIYTKGQ